MRLCFVDSLGLLYTGNTLESRGLGGSESAVIFMGKELTKLGVDVTVYCNCEQEGVFDGVNYYDLKRINDGEQYDVMVSLRSVIPLIPPQHANLAFGNGPTPYESMLKNCRYKVLWLHDTFVRGDQWVESLVIDGFYDEIFCLSDWHSNYIMNGHNWRQRIFEVLKKKVYETRNGVTSYFGEVDIKIKDPNLFVYNSSVSKGMEPLLKEVWPEVKQRIPEAKLTIIGGYYRGANQGNPDEQEIKFYKLMEDHDGKLDVHFTNVITQQKIAEILTRASFMLYPCIFPETFGISTLEAINYNVPLLGCRFGALEEVALDQTSYMINYDYNHDPNQKSRFVDMVVRAYSDRLLLQQKMYACNEVKPYIGWDTVAMQWKMHLYQKLGFYQDIREIQQTRHRTNRVNKIFGRRFINPEDIIEYTSKPENKIVVITPFYNCEKYLENCIKSVASQDYDNYEMWLIDDLSDDNSIRVAEDTASKLDPRVASKFHMKRNTTKKFALQNQVETIQQVASADDIVILLDGDDWLTTDPDIFNFINNKYNSGAEMTYGSCHSLVDNINLIAQPYPLEVHKTKSYRRHLFNWGMPYTHMRTFRKSVFDRINPAEFLDENGEYYKAGHDNALFYPLLENVEGPNIPDKIKVIQRILYVYNDTNPLNDYKVHGEEQNANARTIRSKQAINMKDFKAVEKIKDEIAPKVRAHDAEAIEIYKDIATNREDVWIDEPDHVYLLPRRDWLLNKIRDIATKRNITSGHLKILDVGSWTGTLANYLYSQGFTNITCMDISTHVVELGQKAYPHLNWICGDVESIKIEEKFDIILMCEVLEHVVKPKKVVERALDWLKPNGSIVYTIPEEENVFGEVRGNNSSEHISRITYKWLSSISNDIEHVDTKVNGEVIYEWYVGSISEDSYDGVVDMGEIDSTGSYKKPTDEAKEMVKHIATAVQPITIKAREPEKRILIALPTAKNVETDTFKSIYRLTIPEGYTTHLECFFGYRIDQVRNLICHWAQENNFDYIFFVDSDIVLPENSLVKLLKADKDIVTGVYIQRKPGVVIPEIYVDNGRGGMRNAAPEELGFELKEIAGCGFGCCLVKVQVIRQIGYPQFLYHPAIKMEDTISEDNDFCMKARNAGFKIHMDPTLNCNHIGSTIFKL